MIDFNKMTVEEIRRFLDEHRRRSYRKGDLVIGWDIRQFKPFVVEEYDARTGTATAVIYLSHITKLNVVLESFVPYSEETRGLLDIGPMPWTKLTTRFFGRLFKRRRRNEEQDSLPD